jgi:hypothetical protein
MEGIKKAMNERNLNEGLWKDRKRWSLDVGQRRKNVLKPIHTYIPINDKNEIGVGWCPHPVTHYVHVI